MIGNTIFRLTAVALMVVGMLFLTAPAEAGNCHNNFGGASVQVFGGQAFGGYNPFFTVNGFGIAAPVAPTVFVVPQSNRHRGNRNQFNFNAFQGRSFEQTIRRGPFGGTRTTTTIR